MPLTVRPMVAEDAAALGEMHHRAWQDTYGEVLPGDYFDTWTVERAADGWRDILAAPTAPDVTRVVAADGQQILGFAVVGPARDTEGRPPATRPTELRGLYVAQSLLGTGLGQRLLDQVLGPGQSAELWVFDANQRAQSFYRRNGFVPDGSVFRDERFPELTEIRMAR